MFPVVCFRPTIAFLRKAAAELAAGPFRRAGWVLPFLLLAVTGCNPVTTMAKIGVRLVGDVIEDEDVKQRGEALVGRPVSAADEMFGPPVDVFNDVHGGRCWRTYPVKFDVLGRQRYVVEARGGRIVSVSKADKNTRKLDVPRALILKEKVRGDSPQECEAHLELGRPLLTARSEKTNCLVQLYEAGTVTDLGTPHYCIVRFDENDRCEDVEFFAVGASTRERL
jgi:hypothetical protein